MSRLVHRGTHLAVAQVRFGEEITNELIAKRPQVVLARAASRRTIRTRDDTYANEARDMLILARMKLAIGHLAIAAVAALDDLT